MFTGIIEELGKLENTRAEGSNLHLEFSCPFAHELKIDQSLAHNGVCLTVVEQGPERYVVTAVEETLKRSNLGDLQPGDLVNLERCMSAQGRFDGHIVQGHVDTTGVVEHFEEREGSWIYRFRYRPQPDHMTVGKGSITVNGVSLTVVDSEEGLFSVAIIPYTYGHTNFHRFQVGDRVNLEFDIIGKYVAKMMAARG